MLCETICTRRKINLVSNNTVMSQSLNKCRIIFIASSQQCRTNSVVQFFIDSLVANKWHIDSTTTSSSDILQYVPAPEYLQNSSIPPIALVDCPNAVQNLDRRLREAAALTKTIFILGSNRGNLFKECTDRALCTEVVVIHDSVATGTINRSVYELSATLKFRQSFNLDIYRQCLESLIYKVSKRCIVEDDHQHHF